MNYSTTRANIYEHFKVTTVQREERILRAVMLLKKFTSDSPVQRMRFFNGRSYLALSGARDGAGARPVNQRVHRLCIGMVVA